jgi:hypothetical protein
MNDIPIPTRRACLRLLVFSILVFALNFLLAPPCLAQEERRLPPQPLFRKDIDVGRQCTVQISYPGLQKALEKGIKIVLAPYEVRRVTANSAEGYSRELTRNDGRVIRDFLRRGYLLTLDSRNGTSVVPAGERDEDIKEAFPELSWLRAENFEGEQSQPKGGCYVYVQKTGNHTRKLLVDKATLYPVSYENGGANHLYSYQEISPGLKNLPDSLLEALKRLGTLPANAGGAGR